MVTAGGLTSAGPGGRWRRPGARSRPRPGLDEPARRRWRFVARGAVSRLVGLAGQRWLIAGAAIEQAAGEVTGWVNVCHQLGEDDLAARQAPALPGPAPQLDLRLAVVAGLLRHGLALRSGLTPQLGQLLQVVVALEHDDPGWVTGVPGRCAVGRWATSCPGRPVGALGSPRWSSWRLVMIDASSL